MNKPAPSPYALKGKLTEGDIKKHLIRLALPMTWGILTIISFQLVDMFFISRLGTEKLAAVSFTFPVTYGIFSFIMGFGIAMSSVASRLIGEGNHETLRRIVTHGLILVFFLTVGITLIGMASMNTLFRALGAPPEMLPLISNYMNVWYAGAVFVSLPMVGNSAIRAGGDARTPALIMTAAALTNVILDPIMIFGLFGFPRMELYGAALATVISNALVMVAGLYVLARREKLICGPRQLHLSDLGNSAKRLLFIALPVGFPNAIQPAVNAFIIYLLSATGAHAVAAYGVVTRVEAFAFVILMGTAVGMSPIIGQNFGAKKYDRVNETLHLAMRFNVIWSIAIAILLGVFADPVAGIFSQDPEVIHYTALFFWIVPFSYAFANLVRGWASAFNAMGRPQRSFIMIIVELLVLMLPAVWMGHHMAGVKGLFIAIALVNLLAGTIFHIWSWKTCRAMEIASTNSR